MSDPYEGREQSEAKHFILKSYLYQLAFKLLHARCDEIAYVDGFSGPWHSKTEDFTDTSFKIALDVLSEVQEYFRKLGRTKVIRCFFVESNPIAYEQLREAVFPYHDPEKSFHVKTKGTKFEDAIPDILEFVGRSFALVFINPTGWTGYPYDKIGPLLRHEPGEVLINYMYEFINRFVQSPDPATETSLDPIMGGPGWRERLDPTLPPGRAAEKLFRQELQTAGQFKYVASTCINKSTVDRPHFFLAHGTRHLTGLEVFRQTEYDALRRYERRRADAKQKRRDEVSGQRSLFSGSDLVPANSIGTLIEEIKEDAKDVMISALQSNGGKMNFGDLNTLVLLEFALRETNVKDICLDLAKVGIIEPTWKLRGTRVQKPSLDDVICLKD